MAETSSDVPALSADSTAATAAAGAVTCNSQLCVITTEALTTAAAADYTLTITNSRVSAGAAVFVSLQNGSNTTSFALAHGVTPTANQVVLKVRNMHASAAFNGTLIITVLVI